jgi:MFS family permease
MLLHKLRTFNSLKIPGFRAYYLSMVGQWAAMAMQNVVMGLLVYRLTGSTAILGTLSLASAIPQIIVAPFAGVLIDRFSKKRLMQMGQVVFTVTSAIIAISLQTKFLDSAHPDSWWLLVGISAIQGMTGALLWSARLAMVPELVGRDKVANATSLTTIGMNVFQLVAPACGGYLIDKVNFEAVFLTIGGFYLISILLTNFLPSREGLSHPRGNVFVDMVEGLKYVSKNVTLLWILIYTLLSSMIVFPLGAMISVFSDSILKVGATGLGLLQGFQAAGALVTVLIIATLTVKKRGLMMLGTGLVLGLAQAAFAFSTSYPLSLAIMIFIGLGSAGQITLATILIQTNSDPGQLGRVTSLFLLVLGISGLITFGSGFVAEAIGVQWTVGGISLLQAAATILILLLVPKLRKLE